jgi:4-diphosphocytidyl-2-C-methyl-D-erythritol kinase
MDAQDPLAGFAAIEHAPAKINLALHVVGQREDGYHLLDSLVTFTDFGDRLGFSLAGEDRFTLSGRFAHELDAGEDSDNLVMRTRDLLRFALADSGQTAQPVHIHLEKNLPIASGVGGGSADAAATLRALLRLWRANLPDPALSELALALGADVPMCLHGRPLVARGIGEDITRIALPALPLVLANPLVGISTPAVFRALATKRNPPLGTLPQAVDRSGWLRELHTLRNDLEPPARALCPEIGRIAASLTESGAALVRMSGSGATCFGIYATDEAAGKGASALAQKHPEWFFKATATCSDGADDGAH